MALSYLTTSPVCQNSINYTWLMLCLEYFSIHYTSLGCSPNNLDKTPQNSEMTILYLSAQIEQLVVEFMQVYTYMSKIISFTPNDLEMRVDFSNNSYLCSQISENIQQN